MLARLADLTWRRPKLVLAAVGVFVVGAGWFAHDVEKHLKAAGFTDSSSESERSTETLRGALGYDPNPGFVVVVRNPDGGPLDTGAPAVQSEVTRISGEIAQVEGVGRVVNPLADPSGAGQVARDGESVVITGHLSTQDIEDEGGRVAEDVDPILDASTLHVGLGGFAPSFNEVNDQTRKDLTTAELIAFPALALLLLLVFRGVVAAGIPLLIGGISILTGFLALKVMSEFVDTSLFALNITTGMSLGLAVDYALLMVSRYREEMGRLGATQEAHRRTVMTAGRTVLFSGATVAAALIALVFLPQRFLYSMGVAGAVVGLSAALLAVLVVPSLLSLLGEKIDALSIRKGPAVSDDSGGWNRLARGVMRRPVTVALASSALMLVIAAPFLSTILTGPSAQAVPPGLPAFDANEYMENHYPRDITEAITVTVNGTAGEGELQSLAAQIGGIEGIARGGPFIRASDQVAFANFAADGPALDARAQDAVDEIRELTAGSAAVLASGNTARFIDQKQSLVDHAPIVIGIVGGSTLILLFLLTGSVLLPLKTLLMNTLTLGATLGILVLAFQEGWLHSPLGYNGPSAVEVTTLVFLSAILFGLATDYAVLVMARIKEQRDLGASNEDAVAIGIGRTGRVITAAAVCIAVVFLAFSVSSVFFMKQAAIGVAIGVTLDATIVRALLVPSLMRLLGEWNWWAPKPLRYLHWRFGFREA